MSYTNKCQYQAIGEPDGQPFIDDDNNDPNKWLKKALPEDNHKFTQWNAFVPLSGELKNEHKGFVNSEVYGTTGKDQKIPTNKDIKYIAGYRDSVSLHNEVNNKKEHFSMCGKFNKSCPHK